MIEKVLLGEVFKYKKGIKPKLLLENSIDGCIPYLTAKYFRENKPEAFTIVTEDNKFVKANKDDVILIWDGSNAGDVFRGLEGALASTMVKFEKSVKIIDDFLYFFLKTKFSLLNSRTTGSTIPHVSKNILDNLEIPFFPLPEQRKIAYVLSTVQKAIEQQEKLIRTTTELKKALMQKLFTEGTKGEKQKQTEIGLVPESWEVTTIGEMYDFTSKPRGLNIELPVPFIPMDIVPLNEIYIERYELRESLSSGTYVENGDLLLAKITPSFENGKQGIVSIDKPYSYATTEVIPIKDKAKVSDKYYLFYYLLKDDVRKPLTDKMEGSTGRQRLSKTILEETLIPKPSFSEQKEIARIFLSIDEKISFHEKKKQTLSALFKTLLHELMTGERRMHEIEFENQFKEEAIHG